MLTVEGAEVVGKEWGVTLLSEVKIRDLSRLQIVF